MTDTTEGEETEEADRAQVEEETTQKVQFGTTPAAGEYSFRLFPAGDSQEKSRAPFPLPAPFEKRLPGDRRSFTLVQNTGGEMGQKSGELLGQKSGQQTNNESLPSSAPALPPKRGRTSVVTMQ